VRSPLSQTTRIAVSSPLVGRAPVSAAAVRFASSPSLLSPLSVDSDQATANRDSGHHVETDACDRRHRRRDSGNGRYDSIFSKASEPRFAVDCGTNEECCVTTKANAFRTVSHRRSCTPVGDSGDSFCASCARYA